MLKGLLALCSSLVQNGPRGRREREFYELISRLVALDRTAALDSQQGHRDFGQVPLPLMFLGHKSCRSQPSSSSTESAERCCCSSQGHQSDKPCIREPCILHGCMHGHQCPPPGEAIACRPRGAGGRPAWQCRQGVTGGVQPPHLLYYSCDPCRIRMTLHIAHCTIKLRAYRANAGNVNHLQDPTEEAEETSSSGRSDEESLAAHAGNADMPFTVRNAVMLSSIPGFCE